MRLWLIPMLYVGGSVIGALVLPRFEQAYFASYTLNLSVASAQAYLSAAASGMMALTAIVFAMGFVMVQFSAMAYSPRLVLLLARDHMLFHSLGTFAATFLYALFTLAWVDRGGSGTVPLFSSLLVALLLIVSMFLFARLVQRLNNLQITSVLDMIGDRGRHVIRETFQRLDEGPAAPARKRNGAAVRQLGTVTQSLRYSGKPRAMTGLDVDGLVRQAARANGIIVMALAVGDTALEGRLLLRVHGADGPLSEEQLMKAIRLGRERTFDQDPMFPLRLLVDIAIKALSPAINDPTTAVQTIDQIEDLLCRLGRRELDAGYASDDAGVLRLVLPMASWEDYLALSFDEIRQYGATSIQVMRRLRSALLGLLESVSNTDRADSVRRYIEHLDLAIEQSPLDAADRLAARQEDRQGLGLSHRTAELPRLGSITGNLPSEQVPT